MKRGEKGKCLACDKPLVGKQRLWCSEACRQWYKHRKLTGFDRELTGFDRELTANQTSLFSHRLLFHQAEILRKKIDPNSKGRFEKMFVVVFTVKFTEKYNTGRVESELYSLINNKILKEFMRKFLEDYNPGWQVEVELAKEAKKG